MPVLSSYDYALIRVVPLVERGEFVNVGAVLFCRTRRFLRATIDLDAYHLATLAALAPTLDLDEVRRHLAAIPRLAAGDSAAGPIARLSQAERFHWLASPSSTIIQPSPVHSGICADPAAALERILDKLVRPSSAHPESPEA